MKKTSRKNLSESLSVHIRAAIGSLLLFLLLAGIVEAGDINITATVDKTVVELGLSIELDISVSGPVRRIEKPNLPDLSAFDVYSSGTSSNFSIMPGAISYSTNYTYLLMPRKVGTYTIGAAWVKYNGKIYSTDPIQIKVVAQKQKHDPARKGTRYHNQPAPRNVQPGSNFFIEQVVDNLNPYLGQQVTMTFRFYQAKTLYQQPSLQWPEYNGLWVEDLPPQNQYNRTINGKLYRVTEIKKALFPTVTGKIVIDPTVLTIPPDAFGSIFDMDPFNFFSNRRSRHPRKQVLRSKKIIMNVRPLPQAGKPADFSGAVGKFNWRVTIDKDSVKVDQPITLKAVISGTGNIKKLPAIEIPQLDNFRLYDSGNSENISKSNYQVSGSKTYEWVLIPTAPGTYELPQLSFTYFDPQVSKYKRLTAKPGKVYIEPSMVAGSNPNERAVNIIPAERNSLNYIVTDLGQAVNGTPLFRNKFVWAAQLLPMLWLISLAVYTKRRQKLEGDAAYARRKMASRAARKALKKAREGIKNPDAFYSLIFNGVVGFVSDKLNMNAAGLTRAQLIEKLRDAVKNDEVIDEFSVFFDECDAGRFSPIKPSPEQALNIYSRAERLLSKLDRSLK